MAPSDPYSSDQPARWLVFRLGHLGDVTLTTGVLAHLAETKNWRFAVATKEAFAPVFTGSPYVEQVFTLGRQDLDTGSFCAWARRTAKALSGWGLLDLHASARSFLLGLIWPGKILRYPKMSLERRVFLATRGRLFGEKLCSLSVPQRYALAVEKRPPPVAALLPRIWLSEAEKAAADDHMHRLFGGGASPVALHPFATHALKAWPAGHWRRLAALLDCEGVPWLSVGVGEALFTGRKEDLTGSTSLRQSCALLARCSALVTGDSGPMHLASAVGVPVIALFGPTTREWGFFPQGPEDIVLESPLACRPCSLHGKHLCGRNGDCLALISPEKVLEVIVKNKLQGGD